MFSKMKLGTKIAAGYVLIIGILVVLGLGSVISMSSVQSGASKLAKEFVPAMRLAGNIERDCLDMRMNIRSFALSGDESFLTEGKTQLSKIKETLNESIVFAGKARNLNKLKGQMDEIKKRVSDYDDLIQQTVLIDNISKQFRDNLSKTAQDYMKLCDEFNDVQYETMMKDIEDPKEGRKRLKERVEKIKGVNEIVLLGQLIQIDAIRAQLEHKKSYIDSAIKSFDEIDQKLAVMKAMTIKEVNLKRIEVIRGAANDYRQIVASLTENWVDQDKTASERTQTGDKLGALALEISSFSMDQTTNIANGATNAVNAGLGLIIVGVIFAVFIGTALAIFITRSITVPINKVIEGVNTSSEQVNSASQQVAQTSQQMAEAANQQSSSLEEATSALQEMTAMIKKNADNAKLASDTSSDVQVIANKGHEAMQKMAEAIMKIKASSDETAKVIKVIDNIAFQTNILALNAAVEAARAGEAGQGFAVVADEVRSLAQRSAEAAKNTAELIEESQRNADNGVQITSDVANNLVQILTGVDKVTTLISEVSVASEEQAKGINEVTLSIDQMNQITQSNAANAEESASASEEMSAQAQALLAYVNSLVTMVQGADSARLLELKNVSSRKGVSRRAINSSASVSSSRTLGKPLSAADVFPLDDDKDFV